ncbi:MAG TPA: YetF domain-containing protein [Thermoanaerobaculia bacterium]|jgi:uncharacterized membrane protein YcaP (DUF421 family)|nr:YetF domain-containing protein [Thermoanaerobaculia bacterium]
MHALWESLRWAFGVDADPRSYNLLQVSLRALLVYLVGLMIIRLGRNRLLGRQSSFDIVLGFVLGSVLSRAINGTAHILVTLVSCLVLVAAHRLVAALSFRSHAFGGLVKGEAHPVVQDGRIDWEQMRREHISERDLEEALRLHAKTADEKRVAEARLERNGEISIVERPKEARVVEVRVAEGIQTVRIEIQ